MKPRRWSKDAMAKWLALGQTRAIRIACSDLSAARSLRRTLYSERKRLALGECQISLDENTVVIVPTEMPAIMENLS